MGLTSALDWFYRSKFVLVLLVLACCRKLTMSQLDGCSEGDATCNRCQDGQYGVDCLRCDCDHFGSLGSCDPVTGACYCRRDVDSRRCNSCGREGWMGPSITSIQAACLQCFCNGYSNNCTSADEWYKASVSNYFSGRGEVKDWIDAKGGNITYEEEGFLRVVGVAGGVELLFPQKYLGDKRTMFGQQLLLTLRQSSRKHHVTMVTVRISSTVSSPYDDGLQLEIPPVAVGNNWQTIQVTTQLMVRGNGPATEQQLRRVLTNISTIALSTVGDEEVTLDVLTVHMDYAKPKILTHGDATRVDYVEECQCPLGREGQFCDKCSPGYARDPPYGGPFAACVKCYCSNKAVSCDPDTGICHNCSDNTAGDHCEHCRSGYYRNLTSGMCLPCQCPGTPDQFNHFASSCDVDAEQNVICSCNKGYVGDTCFICDDGYYGNPLLPSGDCKPCNCHNNTNPLLQTCDTTTGVCNCVHPYVGNECQLCADDYYGNAEQQNCTSCECYTEGTLPKTVCNRTNGQCVCRDHVTGRRCDQCEDGYWNITSSGCASCNCDSIGSTELSCDQLSGRCSCRHGYSGTTCDVCSDGYYRHSNGSCIACECKSEASLGCDSLTGMCMCRQGVTGRSCDACELGTDNLWPDCFSCDDEFYVLLNGSIFELTEIVGANVSTVLTSNTSSVNVSVEEFDRLCDIVDDISAIVNSSQLTLTEVNRVDQLVVMVTQQVIPLIQAASEINASIININASEMILLKQLEMMEKILTTTIGDLSELQLEFMAENGTNWRNQVHLAFNTSSIAYEVISNNVLLLINMVTNNSIEYDAKLKTYVPVEADIYNLSSLVNNVMKFARRTNSFLCGDDALSIESHSNCDGVFRISMTTFSEIVISLVEINEYLSRIASVESQLKELSDMLEQSLHNLNIISDHQLPNEVMMLKDHLLVLNENLSNKLNSSILLLLELLVNQSLQLNLHATPVEVIGIIDMINRTIDEFTFESDINEVISRINNTLHLALSIQQTSRKVATDSLTEAMTLEELQQKQNSIVDEKDRISSANSSYIERIRTATKALEDGIMLVGNLNMSQLNLEHLIENVTSRNNSQFATLLNISSNEVFNLSVNSTQEWRTVDNTVNELVSNSSAKASKSEQMRNQSEWLLMEITKLLNDTMDQQNALNDLREQYNNYSLTNKMIEDDVKSVRITLEALIRDISRIATANTNCINPLSGG